MKRAIPLMMLALLFSLSSGCSSVDAPEEQSGVDPIVSESIGVDGGTLATDDFSLSIPAGAFTGTHDLDLYSSETISELQKDDGESAPP